MGLRVPNSDEHKGLLHYLVQQLTTSVKNSCDAMDRQSMWLSIIFCSKRTQKVREVLMNIFQLTILSEMRSVGLGSRGNKCGVNIICRCYC